MFKEEALLNMIGVNPLILTADDPIRVYEEYKKVEEAVNIFKESQERFKNKLKELAEKHGEQDEKGSFTCNLPDGSWFKKEARTSVSLNNDKIIENYLAGRNYSFVSPKVIVKLQQRDLQVAQKLVDELVGKEEVATPLLDYEVYPDEIEEAYQEGEITAEDMKELVTTKVTYALTKSKK